MIVVHSEEEEVTDMDLEELAMYCQFVKREKIKEEGRK